MYNFNQVDDQLWELQKACNRYAETDCLATWVLYAVANYIETDKATHQFVENFIDYPVDKLEGLIRICLNGDRSHDSIIKTCKKVFNKELKRRG